MTRLTKLEGKPVSALPVGYCVTGYSIYQPEVGKRMFLDRPIRTSLNEYGFDYFTTTEVTEVFDGYFLTKNSKWKMEKL